MLPLTTSGLSAMLVVGMPLDDLLKDNLVDQRLYFLLSLAVAVVGTCSFAPSVPPSPALTHGLSTPRR